MSDPTTPPDDSANVADEQGFVRETGAAPTAMQEPSPATRDEHMRRNLRDTFGSGPGKLALIAAVVVIFVFGAFAASGFRQGATVNQSEVDAPKSPANKVTTNQVTPAEAQRRAEQARLEAEAAQQKGGSYQPGFDYNIGLAQGGKPAPAALMPAQPASAPIGGLATGHANEALRLNQQEQQRAQHDMQQNEQRLATEVGRMETDRDKYVESVKGEIVKQIGGLFASQGADSLNALGSYSQVSYYTPPPPAAHASGAGQGGRSDTGKITLVKAGQTYYSTLDSEANTDDGRLVMATVRSGKYKGAKLIGNLEQTNNNIQLSFHTLAPQDDRPTMRIRAVALREEDAKVGMAETIDHHTLSRYSSLAAAALLTGFGRIAMQPSTTTYLTTQGIITTVDQSTNRQALGGAISEMGSAVGSEIRRRGYNQPSTYSTPAQQGFMLYFLEDVAGNPDGSGTGGANPMTAGGVGGIGGPALAVGADPGSNATPLGRGWDQSAAGTMGGMNPNANGNSMPGYGGYPGMGGMAYPGMAYPGMAYPGGYATPGYGVAVPYPGVYTNYRPN